MKKITIIIGAMFSVTIALIVLSSCEDVFDKDNLGAISPSIVFTDKKAADAYMVNVAAASLPGWPQGMGNWIDESFREGNTVAYGEATSGTSIGASDWNSHFRTVRKINVFLEGMEDSSLDQDLKNALVGQAYFWRAYIYFQMVNVYGGIPYLREVQDLDDDLFVARNTTSECFDFIVEDIEQAINLLPANYSEDEAGKVNKAAAYALKGRILLYRASPQFNPDNIQALWNEALTANQEAYDWLVSEGYELYPDFEQLWFDELNNEAIFVTRYNNPEKTHARSRVLRPLSESFGGTGETPSQQLVEAFPMIDGTSIQDHPEYSLETYTENRDPRFYATVKNNGDVWELSGKTGRIQYTYIGYGDDGYGTQWGTQTGYFFSKAVDPVLEANLTDLDGTDWIEIRLAEVMLNYAEAANMTGDQDLAYEMLTAIRDRAGILPGVDDLYGLEPGMNQDQMLEAIIHERQIEFATEGKRFHDMRRLRRLQDFNGMSRRGLKITPIDENDLSQGYTYEIVDVDTEQQLNYPENYYFFPIPQDELNNNPNLLQTDGWYEGGFDPLQ